MKRLGASWGAMARFWVIFLEKLGRRWAQHEPSWQQVAPKMSHVSVKMGMLGSVWEALGGFGKHFLEYFGRCIGYQNTFKKHLVFNGFLRFWGGWMGWLRHLGSCLGPCWLQDGDFWSMLGRCCVMLAARWRPRAPR